MTPLKSSTTLNGSASSPLVTGHYADPFSPIASSPRPSSSSARAATDPSSSDAKKESMIVTAAVAQPAVNPDEETSGTWTTTLFSPVLKLFGDDDSRHSDNTMHEEIPEISIETEEEEHQDEGAQSPSQLHPNEFDPFLFIAQLPPYDQVKGNVQCASGLPPQMHPPKLSLVLDLDETLVHCSAEPTSHYDVTFDVLFNGSAVQVFVRKRPHLDLFLQQVSELFEVTVFTASQRVYAERLLDLLDPQQKFIQHRLYRESCLVVAGNLLKDLNVLDRDLSKTLIVDNSPHAFGYQIDNGVPIESWFDDPQDTELLKLLPFLRQLAHPSVDDVRPFIRQNFGVAKLVREAGKQWR